MVGKIRQYLRKTINESKYLMKLSTYALLSAYAVGCNSVPPNKDNYDWEKSTCFDVKVSTGMYSINPIILVDEDKNGLVDKIVFRDKPDFVIAADIRTHPDYIEKLNMYPQRGLPYAMDDAQIKKCSEFAKQYVEFAYYLDSLQYAQEK